jgi:hypothetical protein
MTLTSTFHPVLNQASVVLVTHWRVPTVRHSVTAAWRAVSSSIGTYNDHTTSTYSR